MLFNPSYVGLRQDLISFVHKQDAVVLDLGCSNGVNGKYLLENKLAQKVIGLEYDKLMAEEAANFLTKVIHGDVTSANDWDKIGATTFDYVFMGDIIEHVTDSEKVLRFAKERLNQDGKIVLSLPNFQHIDVWVHLYRKGFFPRNDRGIFDKTHLRFFTQKNVEEMLDKEGLKIIEMKRHFRFRDSLDSKFPFYGFLLKRLFPKLYTFQFVFLIGVK